MNKFQTTLGKQTITLPTALVGEKKKKTEKEKKHPFWPFEISEAILRSQKFIISLDSFSNQRFISSPEPKAHR